MNRRDALAVAVGAAALLGAVYLIDWQGQDTTPTDLGQRWFKCTGQRVKDPAIRWEPVVNRVEWVDHFMWQVVVDPSRKDDPLVYASSVPHGFAHLLTQTNHGDTEEHGPEFQTVLLEVQACMKRF